ncbi:MAG: histidine phosphatase family protein [Hyphococcus sp.]
MVPAPENTHVYPEIFEALGSGGYVLVLRHANSPGGQQAAVGMTDGCVLGEGRGLDAQGLFQARYIGAALKAAGTPLLKAYTSDMCRSWDTARLAAGGADVVPHPSQKTTDLEAIAAFKKEVEAELAANPGWNIMLVSHSNIAPLYGAAALDGEAEIPSGAVFAVKPPDWGALQFRVDFTVNADPQTVTVD